MILSICESADVLSALRLVKIIIRLIRVLVPILLLVSLTLDFVAAMTSHDDDALNKTIRSVIPKSVAVIAIFFIPQFVSIVVGLTSSSDAYKLCLQNATVENISRAYIEEADVYMKDAEKNVSRSSLNLARRAVNRILDDDIKKEYLEKLDNLEYVIVAKEWLNRLRQSLSQSDYDKASEAISKVPFADMRAELEKELEQISLSMAQSVGEYSSDGYVVNPLGIPYYNQCDPRWGNYKYDIGGGSDGGMATLCSSSCGYTSLAMVVAGLSGDLSVVPLTMVELFRAPLPSQRGYGAASIGELSDASKLAKYNVYPEVIGTSHESVMAALNSGKALVVLRPGHYVCLVGDGAGQVIVLDPYWSNHNGRVSIDNIESAIQGNITSAIAYSRR